jgi:hypothetical protein
MPSNRRAATKNPTGKGQPTSARGKLWRPEGPPQVTQAHVQPTAVMSNTLATSRDEMLRKVPSVTIFFWIIKVLCTTVGETASDFLNVNLGFGLKGTAVAAGSPS